MSLAQLSRLLPLPDEELKQVLEYASTLSKNEAAEHFTNLLGESPEVIDFVSSFNSRRAEPKSAVPTPTEPIPSTFRDDGNGVAKHQRHAKKKKAPLHTPAPRQVESGGVGSGTVYNKKNQEEDYIVRRSGTSTPSTRAASPARQIPTKTATPPPSTISTSTSKALPSAAGTLVSDLGLPKQKNKTSRSFIPGQGPKNGSGATAKVSIVGGTPMQGASTALADLDSAIRSLELLTNPSHSSNNADVSSRRCNCVAMRHPLQAAAPNCLSCGKVICVKEGLGPCTFCGAPLLSSDEIQTMIRQLKVDRGQERMAADRGAHKKADVSTIPRPFTKPRDAGDLSMAEAKAREHRDKLLGFQAQNAKRTTVRDEAADFDITDTGNTWSSPEERARQLKKQQKLLREMEWNAKPDYEKRRQVVSIDLVNGKIVKKMAAVERPPSPEDEPEPSSAAGGVSVLEETDGNRGSRPNGGGGAFSRNPLLGGMVKPVYDLKGKGPELEGRKPRNTTWRRVQDDLDNNESVILDGGIHGGSSDSVSNTQQGGDEPDCG